MISHREARHIAAFYGSRGGEGSGALRYFARTGIVGRGLRAYLSGPIENMSPNLAELAKYVRAN